MVHGQSHLPPRRGQRPGPVHVRTSMHHADTLLRLLMEAGIQPNCITDHGMSEDDARVVVLLGVALHDVGMSIHRDRHELLSVPIALDWMRRKLPPSTRSRS